MTTQEKRARDIASGAIAPDAAPALIQCVACARQISSKAPACPHCGEPRPEAQPEKGQTATGCLAAILIGLLIGGVLYFLITAP